MEFRLLKADEIEVRAATCNQYGLTLLLYKDARVDQNILDETVGATNWQRHHSRDNANCTVSIWDDTKKQWIEKEDTGTESNTEKEKGLASDSFKRACFNWGIGRELYTAPKIKIKPDSFDLRNENNRYFTYDTFEVSRIGYDANRKINDLVIRNTKTKKVVFSITAPAAATPTPAPQKAPETQPGAPQPDINPEIAKAKIDGVKLKVLINALEKEGIPQDKIFKLYKVTSLADITELKFSHIFNHIEDIKKV